MEEYVTNIRDKQFTLIDLKHTTEGEEHRNLKVISH